MAGAAIRAGEWRTGWMRCVTGGGTGWAVIALAAALVLTPVSVPAQTLSPESPSSQVVDPSVQALARDVQIEQVIVPGFDPEYDYEYPPSGKKSHHRRPPAPPSSVAPAAKPRRERDYSSSPQRKQPSHIAPDGFQVLCQRLPAFFRLQLRLMLQDAIQR